MKGLLSSDMATRNVADMPDRPDHCTDFQIYSGKTSAKNVIDFTERKLIAYALSVKDVQQKLVLAALVVDYRAGRMAIAWRRGLPVPIKVTKDK